MYVEPKYNKEYAKSVTKKEFLSNYSDEAKPHAEQWYDSHVAVKKEEPKEADKK